MKREEFIEILDQKGYSFRIQRNKIIVDEEGDVYLESLTSLSPDVEFKNGGRVNLGSLTSLPPGVEFKNGEEVYLGSLTSISPDVEFKNGGNVYLGSLTSISPGVVFRNGDKIYLKSLIGGWFYYWEGNIEGIDSKRLLNLMIKGGIFI